MSTSVKHEVWIVQTEIANGNLPSMDDDTYFARWFEREYVWPALYTDEGGQG